MYTISYRTGFFRRKVKVLRHELKENLHYARAKDSAICMVPAHRIKELIVFADYYTSEAYRAQHPAPSAPKAQAPSAPVRPAPEASVSHLYPVESPQAPAPVTPPSPPMPTVSRMQQADPAMQTEIMRRAMARMQQE